MYQEDHRAPRPPWEVMLGYTDSKLVRFASEDIYAEDDKFFGLPEDKCYIMNPNRKGFLATAMRLCMMGAYAGELGAS